MRKSKILLFISWVVAIFTLAFITFYNQNDVDKFIGITMAKEHEINFSYPVELKKVFILPGGEVKKGELVAELIRSDLSAKIEILNHEIDITNMNKRAKQNEINAKLQELDTNYKFETSKIDLDIKEKEFELDKSKKLLGSIMKINANSFDKLEFKIESLKSEKELKKSSYNIQKKHLLEQLKYENEPFEAKIKSLLQEKKILSTKEEKLTIYSPVDGTLGSINYSENSQIKPFDTILDIHSKYPEFVVGFIHESLMSNLKIGESVAIKVSNGLNCDKNPIYGTIENIENKLENIPIELKKYKAIPLRGYKVLIKLPKNDFKLGKRVIICKSIKRDFSQEIITKLLEFLNLK